MRSSRQARQGPKNRKRVLRQPIEELEPRLLLSAASLVYDINKITAPSNPSYFVTAGNELFFSANDGVHGQELWKSDGTAAGTRMVADLVAGSGGFFPEPFAALGSGVFFTSTPGGLWFTDGTAAGTTEISTVKPSYSNWIVANGRMYFEGTDAQSGSELWVSDGTAAGTHLLLDINSGSASSSPNDFAEVNGEVYFAASTPSSGNELWESDGTATGTMQVADINPGADSSNPQALTAMNGKLYFTAVNATGSTSSLYVSDGTAAGTQQVYSGYAYGVGSIYTPSLGVLGNNLFFTGYDSTNGWAIWRSDGTTAGTGSFMALAPVLTSAFYSFNGKAYFSANNQFWQTDGTGSGTVSIASLPGAVPLAASTGTYLYFESPSRDQLWRTDGTVAGTTLVTTKVADPSQYQPNLASLNGQLLYDGWIDGGANVELIGIEPGASQPTLIKDINPQAPFGSYPQDFIQVGNQVFFLASDGTTTYDQLWVTDGTAANTRYLASPQYLGSAYGATALGNSLLFVNNQTQLWISDGTTAGTKMIMDLGQSMLDDPRNLATAGNRVFFSCHSFNTGSELWVTDGTTAGTHMVDDIWPGSESSSPTDITAIGNTVYFAASDGFDGVRLWKSDGTAQGTKMVIQPTWNSPNSPSDLTDVAGTLYLMMSNVLWKSDGTAAGTVEVTGADGLSVGPIQNLAAVGNELYFSRDTENGWELWKSDGTSSGTVMVDDIDPGATSSNPTDLTALGNELYFKATDTNGQGELFKSDGTAAGTIQLTHGLVDSNLGANNNSGVSHLTAAGNTLFFAASDGVHGEELWRSDGTVAGTVMVQDISPGDSLDLNYEYIMIGFGNGLLFAANDGQIGDELWRADDALIADAGGPYQVSEGQTLTLSAANSEALNASIVSYEWDLNYSGDGGVFNVDATGVTANLSGLDGPSTRVVAVRVTDADGNVSIGTAQVQVLNVPPTLKLSGPPIISTASPNYTLSLSSSDPGPDTISSWNITWGDGKTQVVTGNPSSVAHVYPGTAATYQITATATDEDGTYSAPAISVQVAIANASISGTYFYDFNGNGIWDSGEAISPSWGVFLDTNGDGIYESGEPELICNSQGQYTFSNLLPGTYRVHPTSATNWTETAPPGGTQVANAISGQTVANVNFGEVRGAAKATASSTPLFTGDSYSVNLSYGGFHSVTSWTLNWGDGGGPQTITGSPTSISHTYASGSGTSPFTILAWANTVDGDAPAAPLTLAVYAAPLLNNGLLSVRGNSGTNLVSFSNSGGLLTLNLDGATKQYNSSAVTKLSYTDPGGNDAINLSGSIPATLNLASGNSTITNNDSSPVYIAAATGKTTINATSGTTIIPASSGTGIQQLDFAAINISSGAKVVFATSSATLGDYSNHANRTVAVVDAGGLNIASGGTLDMGDNDMILNYASANEAATNSQVFNLLASGITPNADWSGTGITSAEAAYDSAVTGTRALGWADNADIGYTSFDGVSLTGSNQILIKFTYYGDADLSGTMDGTDLSQFFAGRSHQGTGWIFADFDYDGTSATSTDLSLYFSGVNGYKQFGAL